MWKCGSFAGCVCRCVCLARRSRGMMCLVNMHIAVFSLPLKSPRLHNKTVKRLKVETSGTEKWLPVWTDQTLKRDVKKKIRASQESQQNTKKNSVFLFYFLNTNVSLFFLFSWLILFSMLTFPVSPTESYLQCCCRNYFSLWKTVITCWFILHYKPKLGCVTTQWKHSWVFVVLELPPSSRR